MARVGDARVQLFELSSGNIPHRRAFVTPRRRRHSSVQVLNMPRLRALLYEMSQAMTKCCGFVLEQALYYRLAFCTEIDRHVTVQLMEDRDKK